MFVELMANIKNEVLNNLFRSTSNLQAFENFLATLPQFLVREEGPTAPTATADARIRHPVGRQRDGPGATGRSAVHYPKLAAMNPAPAVAGRNTRTAAAASRDGEFGYHSL